MIIDNHKSKPRLSRSPFRRKIKATDNANGMPKSPAPELMPLSDASWRAMIVDGLPPIHHYEPTSMSFNEYLGSNNFQVTNLQGQAIGSYPHIARVITDSGPMRGGTQIFINDENFGPMPQSTFGAHIAHFTVDRASVPGTIASHNNIPTNYGRGTYD